MTYEFDGIMIANGIEIAECTAVALEAGDTEIDRQNALFVRFWGDQPGDRDWVVFGYEMPKDVGDFDDMLADFNMWSADWETLDTVIFS